MAQISVISAAQPCLATYKLISCNVQRPCFEEQKKIEESFLETFLCFRKFSVYSIYCFFCVHYDLDLCMVLVHV